MVEAFGQNFLSLGFRTNGIGICFVNAFVGNCDEEKCNQGNSIEGSDFKG